MSNVDVFILDQYACLWINIEVSTKENEISIGLVHKLDQLLDLPLPVVVVVVPGNGVSYKDIDGNIGLWLHADSSHTLR